MKVLHAYSGNLFGGVETLLLAVSRARDLCPGMEPSFALCFEGRLSRELVAQGTAPRFVGNVRVSRPWSMMRARRELRDLLRRERPDAVICHSPWTQAVLGPAVVDSGAKLVFWLHDAITGRAWIERWAALTRPSLAICNSRFTETTLENIYPRTASRVIHCPVPKPSPIAAGKRAETRAALGIPDSAVVILQASRMQRWKGQLLHLETLSRLKDVPGWTSLIAGGPQRESEEPYFQLLERRAAELGLTGRVRFLGQRSDVPELLAASDIHFQPNEGPEPFGIAFVEALYSGVPVVSTAMGGALEIITPGCGILAPAGDVEALAASLRSLVESPELRRKLGSAGPARAHAISDPAGQLGKLHHALKGNP